MSDDLGEPFTGNTATAGKQHKFAILCDVECRDGEIVAVHPMPGYRVYVQRDGKGNEAIIMCNHAASKIA